MTALRRAASGESEADGPDLASAVQRLFGLEFGAEIEAETAAVELVESPGVASLEPVP